MMPQTIGIVIAVVITLVILAAAYYLSTRPAATPQSQDAVSPGAACTTTAECGPNNSCVRGACVRGIVVHITDIAPPAFDGSLTVTGYTASPSNRGTWIGKPVEIRSKTLGVLSSKVTNVTPASGPLTSSSSGTPDNFVTLATGPGLNSGATYVASPADYAVVTVS